uniref:Uncharacterized protein n=1 Tax=Arundo donax TaxID=35708 RepID=A0A0A9FM59_ARUDO
MTLSLASTRPRSKGNLRWCTERPEGGRRRSGHHVHVLFCMLGQLRRRQRAPDAVVARPPVPPGVHLPVAPAPPHIPMCRGQAVSNDEAVVMTIGTDQM